MMQQLGTKIYYCTLTGNVLQIVEDRRGSIVETTLDEDCVIYDELRGRDKSTIGILKFEYGKYPTISYGSTGVRVDLETKELIFSYDEIPLPPQEPNRIDILQDKISILEEQNTQLKEELNLTQNAVNELLFSSL